MFETIRHKVYQIRNREPSVLGLWERTDDRFAGCVVIVERVGEEFRGRIAEVPASMRRVGWMVGDVKWKMIEKCGRGQFRLMDLFKSYDTSNTEIVQANYQPSKLCFVNDDRFYVVPSGAAHGSTSLWVRIGTAGGD